MRDMTIEPEPVPLRWDEHGRLMIVGHRIALEIIVHAYRRGRSAEAIHESYPSLELADIHIRLGYYLRHEEQINAYVAEQERLGEEARARHEQDFPPEPGLRQKLMGRLEEKKRSGRPIEEIIAAEAEAVEAAEALVDPDEPLPPHVRVTRGIKPRRGHQ